MDIEISGITYTFEFDKLFNLDKPNRNGRTYSSGAVESMLENWTEMIHPGFKKRKERKLKLRKIYGKNIK